jgi:lysophospholipase L1-like esterase
MNTNPSQKKELSSSRLLAIKLTVILISLGFSLLFAEFVLRVRVWYNKHQVNYPVEVPKTDEFSPTRHHRLVPHVKSRHKDIEYDYIWANNSLGMRDRERSLEKVPNTFRMLFLGDSMVQGYGVPLEKSMVYLLENSINQPQRQNKIEILNAGVFGYSPFLEYLYLKEIAPKIKPDLVLVGLFLGNDIGDDYFYTQQAKFNPDGSILFERKNWPNQWPWDYLDQVIKEDKALNQENFNPPAPKNSGIDKIKKKLQSGFMKSQLIREIVLLQKQTQKTAEVRSWLKQAAETRRRHRDDIRVNLGIINYPVRNQQERLKYWNLSLSYLSQIQLFCQTRKIPMILVVIPDLHPDPDRFNEPYQILDNWGRKNSIPVIQLFPTMSKNNPEKLVFELDGHWNEEGNKLASQIIDKELRHFHLLPP